LQKKDEENSHHLRDIRTRRKLMAILQVLHDAERPLGGTRIAQELQAAGFELSQRTVRHYLIQADKEGLTIPLGRRGRKLTPKGIEEAASGLAVDKVGFIAAKVEGLSYRTNFSLTKARGKIILNISTFDVRHFEKACKEICRAFEAGLGMGRCLAVGAPGTEIGGFHVPEGRAAIGTVCSVSLNGVLLKLGIAATSVFGGLLEIEHERPYRFTQIIHYAGSTIDPLEIFIKGQMTSVREAGRTGHGAIGASFREIPTDALSQAKKAVARMERIGLGGALLIGRPGQPLLDVPVARGRVGLVVAGGLNPVAAVEESGIPTQNIALHTLYDFERLISYTELKDNPKRLLQKQA